MTETFAVPAPALLRGLLAAVLALSAGCRTFDPKHPMRGRPKIEAEHSGIWVWQEKGAWHVRASPGGRARRFQGSVAGLRGGILDLRLTQKELKDRVAPVGEAVQFDLEGDGTTLDGFDVRVAGGCARFDLYVDGQHRPDRVRLGPRQLAPKAIPFDRCP